MARRRISARERARAICDGCGRKRATCECLELHLLRDIRAVGLPEPIREYPFAMPRKWRADFCWVDQRLLVEVDGGSFRSRHREKEGFARDLDKLNSAALLGWRVLRFDAAMVKDGRAVGVIEFALTGVVAPGIHLECVLPNGDDEGTHGSEPAK